MSDAQQAPVIQLVIDQALFVEAVHQGDLVEDATVATEVTNLNHIDSAYVLHGAIVLAGRLRHAMPGGQTPSAIGSEMERQPLELRLPFTLRVPDKSQPRGIVNVASRIANCRFAVVDDHWLHMEADLQVSGLNGKDGFAFQCGSQEFRSLIERPSAKAGPRIEHDTDNISESAFNDLGEVDEPTIEFIPPILHDVEAASHQPETGPSSKELAEFDRALDGHSVGMRGFADTESAVYPSEAEEQPVEPVASAPFELSRGVSENEVQSDETAAEQTFQDESSIRVVETPRVTDEPVSDALETFEFEYQVTPDEAQVPTASDQYTRTELPFSAARSFQDDSFRPHIGFTGVPDAALRSATSPVYSTPVASTELDDDGPAAPTISTTLWSFVDFNQPDTRYTLRYAVVMEDESLQSLAERLGCRASDIAAANRLSGDHVYAGQTLRIPASVVNFTGRSSV